MASPVGISHCYHHALILAWLDTYAGSIPGVCPMDNVTKLLDVEAFFQVDNGRVLAALNEGLASRK